jgi:uncharacterized membrane protein YeaQ/YmgE (transglycosylase-associated protein family)
MFGWILYGLVVGCLAKFLMPGDDPKGILPTIGIGVAGSFVGGAINWMLSMGGPMQPAGIVMGVVGGMVFCWVYRTYLKKYIEKE